MAWKKHFKTKDGKIIILRDLNKKDSPRKLMNFINSFVDEKAFLLVDKKWSLAEERKWISSTLEEMKKGQTLLLVVEDKGKIIGTISAERQKFKLRNNVLLGIAIKREYRNQGLGYIAMKEVIKRVRKEMKPKNIYLTVISQNKLAKKLYEKLGFRHHHILKNWVNHYGKYYDEEFMILEKIIRHQKEKSILILK